MKKIFAKIQFFDTVNGGKQKTITSMYYGCPVNFKNIPALSNHAYDCRLQVSELKNPTITSGDTIDRIRMMFLSANEVEANIQIGTEFTLWEMGVIAEGVIIEINS